MSVRPRPRVVLFDAYETLVALDDPVGRLTCALAEAGYPNDVALVRRAFAAEVAYYREHQDRGRDATSLDRLRRDCAAVLGEALAFPPPQEVALAALLRSLVWKVYEDVRPALDSLAAIGCRLAVVSNWDVSLPDVLTTVGIAGRFALVAVSALVGVRKPNPEIFRHALRTLRVDPRDAVHVGNDPVLDVAGAMAAGIGAILIDRTGAGAAADVPVVASLVEAARWIGARGG